MGATSLTEPTPTRTRASRIIKARPEAVYAAFMDPAALVDWLPPAEMTGKIHSFDAQVGGGYRMSLFYPPNQRSSRGKTSDREDMVNVRFVELEPPRRIVEAVSFVTADPALLGEMTIVVTFDAMSVGTEVTARTSLRACAQRTTRRDHDCRCNSWPGASNESSSTPGFPVIASEAKQSPSRLARRWRLPRCCGS